MNVYVDIDETICYYAGERDYNKALPMPENIEKINKLYDEGNEITYWTARGSLTEKDWTGLTLVQLEQWGVRYHELKMGKPYFDMLIDDKAVNVKDLQSAMEKLL